MKIHQHIFFCILSFCLFMLKPMMVSGQLTWKALKSADTLKNPLENNYLAAEKGKLIFNKTCHGCHGEKGKGDGNLGVDLDPRPENLTIPAIQHQTDGALFWKITNGNSPMPGYKMTLTDEQRWQLVNYIRELGKIYKP